MKGEQKSNYKLILNQKVGCKVFADNVQGERYM